MNMTGEQYAATKYNEYKVNEATTLMDFLMKELHGISRNRLKDILRGHGISVDRKLVTQYNFQLLPGMTVRVSKHRRKTELDNKWVKIIYEDKDIIVIEKTEGILSMAATGGQFCVKTVLDEYFQRRHFKCHAHVVHRLDRETSGLMVYAKTIEAARILESDWKRYVFDRRYIAVVAGCMEREGGTVESWLKDNKEYITYSSSTDNGGKFAVTHYHTLKSQED
ncbi:MAG: RNA pseudouridine synthase, partial [Bacteroidaceae bacterium]|nr:RNA pseudouridine synthase [Bacteroidaceae bacterium]